MKRADHHVCTLLGAMLGLLAASPSLAATWKPNVNYGATGGPTMDLYVPDKVAPSPAIVVAIHFCNGNSGSTHGWFQSMSDKFGFIIISPSAGTNCWDSSPGRTGSKAAIVAMVQYVIKQNNADPTKVFAAGASSGACMTQTLLASYPEIFAAGSSLAGVPVGAWPPGTSCNGVCMTVAPSKTAQQWGDLARAADTGFVGSRPPVQLWHGTSDTTLVYPSMSDAEDAQWRDVFGVTDANGTKETGKPSSVWSRTSYKDPSGRVVLEVNIGQGQPHDLTSVNPSLFPDVIRFFGLDQASAPGTGGAGGTTGNGGASSGGSAGSNVNAGSAGNGGNSGGPSGVTIAGSGGTADLGTAGSGGLFPSSGGQIAVNGGGGSGSVVAGGSVGAGKSGVPASDSGSDGTSSGCSFGHRGSTSALSLLALVGTLAYRARRRRRDCA